RRRRRPQPGWAPRRDAPPSGAHPGAGAEARHRAPSLRPAGPVALDDRLGAGQVPLAQPALVGPVTDDDVADGLAVAALRAEAGGVEDPGQHVVGHRVGPEPATGPGRAYDL